MLNFDVNEIGGRAVKSEVLILIGCGEKISTRAINKKPT